MFLKICKTRPLKKKKAFNFTPEKNELACNASYGTVSISTKKKKKIQLLS